jgi:hypothetical protein
LDQAYPQWRDLIRQDQKEIFNKATTPQGRVKIRPIQRGGSFYDIQTLRTDPDLRREAGVGQQEVRWLKADDKLRVDFIHMLGNIERRVQAKKNQGKNMTPYATHDPSSLHKAFPR